MGNDDADAAGAAKARTRENAAENRSRSYPSLQSLDRGLVLEQDGDPIPDWVHPLALIAFQTFVAAQHKRLATNWTHENFEKFRGNHDGAIVAAKPSAISS